MKEKIEKDCAVKIKDMMNLFFFGLVVTTFSTCSPKTNYNFGDNPEAGHYAKVKGIMLYYELYGKGNPLVLLHGNGGSIEAFKNQIPFFEKKFQIIAIDSRLHGKSGGSPDTLSYTMIADDVSNLLDQLKIDSAYVLGWSDGGIDGIVLAMNFPEKVKALAVSGANILSDSASLPISDIIGMKEVISPGSSASIRDKTLNRMMLFQPNIQYAELSEKIKCPVLIMAGDHDIIKPEHTIKIFQSIKNAEMCIFPNSNHGALQDHPVLFNTTVDNFFDRN